MQQQRLASCLVVIFVGSLFSAVLGQNVGARREVRQAVAKPTSQLVASRPLADVKSVKAKKVDRKAMKLEDDLREEQGLPPRFAITNAVRITPDTDGTWENVDDQTLMWRLRVFSPDALSINLGFVRYHMPPGARLIVHSADYQHVIRPFTDADNQTYRQLWTPPVISDDIVVELTIPEAVLPALELELGSINVGYRGFGEISAEKSGACNVDVVCPEGDLWRDQIQSVAVYSTGGTTFCTGFMVNNTSSDLTPYFMTADHCGIGAANAPSLVVFWNYENSTCRAVGSPASGGPGDGTLTQFQTGSIFRAGYTPSDFTLVQLSSAPDPSWNVGFSGWDRSAGDSTSAVAIHHPNTDEKRISFENQATTTTSYLENTVPGAGTHIRVIDWDLGTTEPGSSGSPLFNQDKRVVGQLNGGFAACGNDTSDWYGRLSVSWTGGGTSSTRLSDWLDPTSTGAMFVDFVSGGGMSVTPAGNVEHIGVAGGPFTNPTVTYTLTNPTPATLDYSVSLTSSFGILLDGGAGPVVGTLAASGGTVDVVVTLGAPINALTSGVFVEDIVFDDITNGSSRTRQHTVEVDQTLFSLSPDTGLESSGPVGGPFVGSIVYTVTSDRPTPFDVQVSSSDSWVSLDGGTSPVTISLNGTGTTGTVTVGFSVDADALVAGTYAATVSFTNLAGGGGDATRPVTLDVGRLVFNSTDTPLTILDNTGFTSEIIVADDFCVGDLDVDIDITHTFIGDLTVVLTSPTGGQVTLHGETGGSADDIVLTYDDEGIPPDGPGALSDFDATPAMGTWTLNVADSASGDTGTLNSWALRIAPSSEACSAPQLIYNFPLDVDPGWTTEGQWAFGQPTGGGSNGGDPTSGSTGLNVYGYNLAGDYGNSLAAPLYLTTTAIDCSQIAGTSLRFQRWLGVESSSFDQASIDVSSDGTTWTTVWAHASGSFSETAWSSQAYNISAVADGQATVFIRWGMGPSDASVTYPGWNLDDIQIWGVGDGAIAPSPVLAEPGGIKKQRFVSFIVPSAGAGVMTALRITMDSLYVPGEPFPLNPPDFSGEEGELRYVNLLRDGVGDPVTSCLDSAAFLTFYGCATVGCDPEYADWAGLFAGEVIHVSGSAIVPDSMYRISHLAASCAGNEAFCLAASAELGLATARHGDVTDDGLTNVTDVVFTVDRVKDALSATPEYTCYVRDESPTPDVSAPNVSDIVITVDALKLVAYALTLPTCP